MPEPLIAVEDIVYARVASPDLDRMEAFLHDFGLLTVGRTDDVLMLRAHGPAPVVHIVQRGDAPATLGIGLRAQSAADLARLAAHTGRPVQAFHGPGGGQVVRLQDPGGLGVDVLHGQAGAAPMPVRAAHAFNAADHRPRTGQAVRQPPGASTVMRLGHVVLLVPDFAAARAFYVDLLGLPISDSYHAQDPAQTIFAFLHCGLGERWTDHHTIAIGTPPGPPLPATRFDHIAYEVLDLDDLMAGQRHLQQRGWQHAWGVGRHVEGSQLFDYWRCPDGLKLEHWTDGDRVNHTHRPRHGPLRPEALAQWAPPFDPDFFRP